MADEEDYDAGMGDDDDMDDDFDQPDEEEEPEEQPAQEVCRSVVVACYLLSKMMTLNPCYAMLCYDK